MIRLRFLVVVVLVPGVLGWGALAAWAQQVDPTRQPEQQPPPEAPPTPDAPPPPPAPDEPVVAPAPTPVPVPAPVPVPVPAPAPAPVTVPAPVETPEAATPSAARAPSKKSDRFIEGELANVGAIGLVPWENEVGVIIGPERIGDIYYASITPMINYSTELDNRPLTMTFGVPIRLELNDTRPSTKSDPHGWSHLGRIRPQDWDQVSDFAQFIRGIQYGGKEKHVYLDVNAFKASSIGHGTILKRYNPNLNLNSRQVSAELDAFGDYGGMETYINNVTGPNVMGGLAFVKPLSFIDSSNYAMRSFSLGATVVADVDAPLRNKLDFGDVDKDGRRANEFLINQKTFQPIYIPTTVVAYGGDAEIKLIDTSEVDWKTYVDYSMLASGVPTDTAQNVWSNVPTKGVQSGGLTWGNLLRLNLGENTVHALRVRAEVRRYDRNYLPSYFDVMYEIQRVQYAIGSRTANPNGTKVQEILGRNPNGGKVFGLYFEASWKIEEIFAVAVGIETNDTMPDNNIFVHLEVPRYKNFQFLATWNRRSVDTAGGLFAFKGTNRDILIAKGRYRVADNFHINVEAITPYGIGPDSFFANTLDFNVNAEFGFGYGSSKR